jgi:heme-degrading monooxygenase HmoA
MVFADMPDPPYVAVVFSSLRTTDDDAGYGAMAERMDELAAQQPGYVGIETARDPDGFGLTVSYWATEAAAQDWKLVTDHLGAQQLGRDRWYQRYIVRVATVERQYDWRRGEADVGLQSPE